MRAAQKWVGVVGAVLLACAGLAGAQPQAVVPAVKFEIKSQPLRDALSEFGQQSGLQVAFLYAEVSDKIVAPRLAGTYSPQEALEQLLANTSLKFTFLNSRTVTVRSTKAAAEGERHNVSASDGERLPLQLAQSDAASPQSGEGRDEDNKNKKEELTEIVVTAQKREQPLKDVPISISVLSGADLDKSSVQGVTEALSRVPGVLARVAHLGGGTEIAIRGVAAAGAVFGGASPIAYYLDSVPFGLVKTAIAPDSNAYDLQQIEVLRGPQGTLYGASAAGGVVRVLTHDADLDEFGLKARSSLSTTDGGGGNYRGDIAVNVPIVEGKLAARAVVGYENLSGWVNNPVNPNSNDAELRNYRLKINAQPTEQFSIGLSAWSSRDDFGAPSSSDENGNITAPVSQPISTDYDTYGLKIGYKFTHFSVSSMTSYLQYENGGQQDLTVYSLPNGFFTGFDANVFSQEVIVNSTHISPWRWSVGAFYRNAKDRLVQTIPALSFGVDYRNTSKSSAVFGELGRRFLYDKLEWTLGLRYFHDDVRVHDNTPQAAPYSPDSSFNSTTPRAVLTWYPNSNLTVYGSYSEGFRSGFPQDPAVGVQYPQFPALKPDKLHNYEVGAKAEFLDKRVSLDTALYYLDWHGVQQPLGVPLGGGIFVSALVNGQSASGVGVDFSVTARPLDGLDLSLNFGWNDLAIDGPVFTNGLLLFVKGDRLSGSSEFTGGVSADYSFPVGGTGYSGRFSVSANQSSKLIAHGLIGGIRTPIEGDSLLTARTSLSLISPNRWTATFYGDNVTNERGSLAPGPSFPSEWTPRMRPRTIGIQLDYHFGRQ